LAACGYAFWAADLPAASIGAPHRRQRLFWVADTDSATEDTGWLAEKQGERVEAESKRASIESRRCRVSDNPWKDVDWIQCEDRKIRPTKPDLQCVVDGIPRRMVGMCAACGTERIIEPLCDMRRINARDEDLFCPVCQRVGPHLRRESMDKGRVAQCGAFGNAIVPQVAAAFIRAYVSLDETCDADIPATFQAGAGKGGRSTRKFCSKKYKRQAAANPEAFAISARFLKNAVADMPSERQWQWIGHVLIDGQGEMRTRVSQQQDGQWAVIWPRATPQPMANSLEAAKNAAIGLALATLPLDKAHAARVREQARELRQAKAAQDTQKV
jgi:hypothetical protein